MEITTFLFAGFLILTGIGYHWLPKRIKNLWMLLASAVFLVSWSWKFLIVLLLLVIINYIFGFLVSRGRFGKVVLWAGIGLDILALLVFKYSDFYLPGLNSLLAKFGVHTGAGGLQILVPIGLSFITVQLISYLVDVHYGRMQAEKGVVKFALYVVYFPKILAGPIERAKPFIARLESPEKITSESLLHDLGLVVVGLVRKLVFADALFAMIPAGAFQQPDQFPAPLLTIWLLEYAFALYNDFAGYSSMVRGISGFFGIGLTSNFNIPYFSRSFSEFWNRWHISLPSWLRDYIFFPLSRWLLKKIPDRSHAAHLLVPPVITMLVSGLWHGLTWNTLLWGALQGGFLVLGQVGGLRGTRKAPGELPGWRQVISAVGVFLCILLAWVPFHTGVVPALHYWRDLFAISKWDFSVNIAGFIPATLQKSYPLASRWEGYFFPVIQMVFVLIPALGLDLLQYKEELRFLKWPGWLLGALLALVIGILFLLSFAEKGAPFVYQGF